MENSKSVKPRKATTKSVEPKYDKADLLNASGFTKLERDILKVSLNQQQQYSLAEAKKAIKTFKEAI